MLRMKNGSMKSQEKLRVAWLYTGTLSESLDGATWVETTRYLRDMGWPVTLFTVGKRGRHFVRGVEVVGVSPPNVYFLRQLVFHFCVIRYLLKRWKDVDVVLFHEMSAIWLLPLLIIRLILKRNGSGPFFVMDTRSLFMPPEAKSALKDRVRSVYLALVDRVANSFVDGRLTITLEMARACNVRVSKLWGTWPSGVDPQPFITAQNKRTWPITDEPICLIYIGSLHYERNLLTFSRAVMDANEAGTNFKLSLVGDGTEYRELELFAAQTNGVIEVVPSIPYEEVPDLLAKAHVGILPFPDEVKFRVSSPIKLFEYMAAGIPILATRIQCHTSVIADGKYVFWAEGSTQPFLKSALEQLWQDRDRLSIMGKEATAAVEGWTWSDAACKLSQALTKGIDSMRK